MSFKSNLTKSTVAISSFMMASSLIACSESSSSESSTQPNTDVSCVNIDPDDAACNEYFVKQACPALLPAKMLAGHDLCDSFSIYSNSIIYSYSIDSPEKNIKLEKSADDVSKDFATYGWTCTYNKIMGANEFICHAQYKEQPYSLRMGYTGEYVYQLRFHWDSSEANL